MAALPLPTDTPCFARDLRGVLPECLSDLMNVQPADPIYRTAELLRKTQDSIYYKRDKYSASAIVSIASGNVSEAREFRCNELADLRGKIDILHEILNKKPKRKNKGETNKMDAMMARFRERRQEVWGQEVQGRIDRGELKMPGIHIIKRPKKESPKADKDRHDSSGSLVFEFDDSGRPKTLKIKPTDSSTKTLLITKIVKLKEMSVWSELDEQAMERMVQFLKSSDNLNLDLMTDMAVLVHNFIDEYKDIPEREKQSALIPSAIPSAYKDLNRKVDNNRTLISRLLKLQQKGSIRRNIRFLDILDEALTHHTQSISYEENALAEEMHYLIMEAHQLMDTNVAIVQLEEIEKSNVFYSVERKEATLLKQFLENSKPAIGQKQSVDLFKPVLDKLFGLIDTRFHAITEEAALETTNQDNPRVPDAPQRGRRSSLIEGFMTIIQEEGDPLVPDSPQRCRRSSLIEGFMTIIQEEGDPLAMLSADPGEGEEGEEEDDRGEKEKEGGTKGAHTDTFVNASANVSVRSLNESHLPDTLVEAFTSDLSLFTNFHNLITTFRRLTLTASFERSIFDDMEKEVKEEQEDEEKDHKEKDHQGHSKDTEKIDMEKDVKEEQEYEENDHKEKDHQGKGDEEEEYEEEEEEDDEYMQNYRARNPGVLIKLRPGDKAPRHISEMKHTMMKRDYPSKFKEQAKNISRMVSFKQYLGPTVKVEKPKEKAFEKTEFITGEHYNKIKEGYKEFMKKKKAAANMNSIFGIKDTNNFIIDGSNQLKTSTSVGVIDVNMRSNAVSQSENEVPVEKLQCWTEYHPDIYTVCSETGVTETADTAATDDHARDMAAMTVEDFIPAEGQSHGHQSDSLTLSFRRDHMAFLNRAPTGTRAKTPSLGPRKWPSKTSIRSMGTSNRSSVQSSKRASAVPSLESVVPSESVYEEPASPPHGSRKQSGDKGAHNNTSSKDISMQMLQHMRL